MKTVVVSGGAGYIGSTLCGFLLERGYRVVCLDRFYFTGQPVQHFLQREHFSILRADIRSVTPETFAGVDAVIDLAGISNDPACDLDPELTESINHRGAAHIAKTARAAGVKRYIMASSCSIYGSGCTERLTEDAPLNPVSLYARAKIHAEQDTRALSAPDFCVTALRLATVFGVSYRMRFDLIVNIMTMYAVTDKRIVVLGGGRQWRPLVHVHDVARAFDAALQAPAEKVNGRAFNIGSNGQNYQVLQVAHIVQQHVPGTEIVVAPDDPDKRNYNVCFDRAAETLQFQTTRSVEEGISEVKLGLQRGSIDPSDIRCSTVKYYKYLIDADRLLNEIKLDGRLF